PKRVFTTTCQPGMVAFSASPPRGLSSDAEALGSSEGPADALADGLPSLPPFAVSSSSPPSTRNPVTPAAITTAVAATIATSLVRFPSPPFGALGPPGTVGAFHCGCCCAYGFGCW